jgi:polyphosphate kinase
MADRAFFSRDISWLSFNQRVLTEAAHPLVPLAERFKFLSIFSSNLDEFYRVRMPLLMAKQQYAISRPGSRFDLSYAISEFDEARQIINSQQEQFGRILTGQLIPLLAQHNIFLLYRQDISEECTPDISSYFFTTIAAFLQPLFINPKTNFLPKNNELYLFISMQEKDEESLAIVNIPSDKISRFYNISQSGKQYIVFIDDILKRHLPFIFPGREITGCFSFKINRDAELNLEDELPDDIADKIEKQIAKRDEGSASRLLHQAGLPLRHLQLLCNLCKTSIANAMEGGVYHNLRDLMDLPVSNKELFYPKQSPLPAVQLPGLLSLFSAINERDIIVHPPYDNYGTVLRFFNEAAISTDVDDIYVTLYRIASDSRIANALISAAKNGKNVQVFVELKARFDEANNIRWAKRMKEAGVKVIYSIPKLKVHAKIALVTRKKGKDKSYIGLLATGNLNESTARFYTDHVLLTSHAGMLREMELLFLFLANRKKPEAENVIAFNHLLVAQFNLQQKFLSLIDREIGNAKDGLPASIIIKLNNLEEQVLINKLYDASNAGVKIQLIVRSICCLVPGVEGMSENITIKRIVGRYLEHGRVFIFHNGGDTQVFMGSADWMNRNIYTRIEVCFPVYDEQIKQLLVKIINLQLADNAQAVWIDDKLQNVPVERKENEFEIDSQSAIYELLNKKRVFKHA